MAEKQIENEEQYNKARDWLIVTSAKLADPIKEVPDREKVMRIYDKTAKLVREYNLRHLAAEFPGLREVYKILGWSAGEQPQQQKPGPSWLED